MDNQNKGARDADAYLWGATPGDKGAIGDRDSLSRAVVHVGWHGANTAVNAVKETVTGDWDYKGTSREAERVQHHWGQAQKGPSPLRGQENSQAKRGADDD